MASNNKWRYATPCRPANDCKVNDLEWPCVAISWQNAFSASTSWIRAFVCQKLYNLCDSAVFCALHDQLASLGTHAQLTRCFSAVAELLVQTGWNTSKIISQSNSLTLLLELTPTWAIWCNAAGTPPNYGGIGVGSGTQKTVISPKRSKNCSITIWRVVDLPIIMLTLPEYDTHLPDSLTVTLLHACVVH